jgi:hypothetical protein
MTWISGTAVRGALIAVAGICLFAAAPAGAQDAPAFELDPTWPKPLPNGWIIGQVAGIAVDADDHVWIVQRPRSLTNFEAAALDAATDAAGNPVTDEDGVPINGLGQPRPHGPLAECCLPAPVVMEFDKEGNLLRAWGGPSDSGFIGPHEPGAPGCDPAEGCDWPAEEHGIFVDHNGFLYIAGNGADSDGRLGEVAAPWAGDHGPDGMVLKFAKDGTFLMQVGGPGQREPSSNDVDGAPNGTPQLWRPADTEVDPETNELYIADGYGNRRIVVVDAETGMYKRHWGAYGQNPVDDAAAIDAGPYALDRDAGRLPMHFRNPVHCVRIADDGLVYVCDRPNNRFQVFDKAAVGEPCDNPAGEAGTCGFVAEGYVRAESLGVGTVFDADLSVDQGQSCVFNADGNNGHVDTLRRNDLELVSSFGSFGRGPGQFNILHNLVVDSEGSVYTAEVIEGKRMQKFRRTGEVTGCS